MDKDLLQKAKAPMIALIEKKNIVENKMKRAFALLLLLGFLLPLAARAQHRDCNGPIAITADAPYTQGFESPEGTDWNEPGPLPDCWDGYNNQVNPHNTYNSFSQGQQSLVFYFFGDSYAILPEFSTAINQLKISFWQQYGNGLQLGYITAADNGTCNTFTSIETYYGDGYEWTQHVTYLSDVPETAHRLAFKGPGGGASCYIDEVEVTLFDGCYNVGTLSINYLTANFVYLSWDLIDNDQTEWYVQVANNADFTENLVEYLADIHVDYLLTNLDGGTTYYVRVKPTCSIDQWSNTVIFVTLCDGPVTMTVDDPYTQGFEDGLLPGCWGIIYSIGDSAPFIENHSHSGFYSLNFGNGTDSKYAALPEFNVPLNLMQISFWMAGFDCQLQLGYITDEDNGTCNTFTAIATYDSNSSWVQYTIYLDNVPTTAHRLVFKCNSQLLCFIDDVEVAFRTLDCYPLGTLNLSKVASNSAYLSWDLIDNNQTSWDVQVATDEAFTENVTNHVADNYENYLVEGLDPNTYYYVRVKSTCSDDLWSNTIQFWSMPPCGGPITVTADAPYTEGFENPVGTYYIEPGPLPACWEAYTTSIVVPHNMTGNPFHNGSQSLSFYNKGHNYAILPEFSNSLNELQISLWLIFGMGQLQLGYLTAEDDGTCNTFTAIETYDTPGGVWMQRNTILEEVATEAQRLALKWSGNSFGCYIDDVEVSINPALIPPRDIAAANITNHTANIAWEGACDSYALRYREILGMEPILSEGFEGGEMPQGWNIEGDNLDPAKTWRVGMGDYSTSTGTHSGNYNALITHNTNNQMTYLVMPALNLDEYTSAELSFWYINRKWSSDIDEFAVCYRIGNEGEWNELWNTTENHEAWTSQSVELTGLANNYQIGFRFTDYYGYGVGLDDIALSGVSISEWTTVSEAESPHTLTGLTPETTYEVQVKSNCAGYEDWSESVGFTTMGCEIPADMAVSDLTATSAALAWTGFSDSYNVRYRTAAHGGFSEDFESETSFANWTFISMNTANNIESGKAGRRAEAAHNGSYGFRFSSYSKKSDGETYDQYLVSPELTVTGELSFYFKKTHTYTETLYFGYSTTTNDLEAFTWTVNLAPTQSWQLYTQDLPTDVKYVAFHYFGNYQYYVYVDDIVIGTEIPAGEWESVEGISGLGTTLGGLQPATPYEWQVQGVCNGEATEWSASAYFTTEESISLPKPITGYASDEGNGYNWYLIASPVMEAVTPTAENGFLTSAFDLYRFNQSEELEWENWKAQGEYYHFNLESGRGYLYASQENTTLTFAGTPLPATEPVEVALAYDPAASFVGWNLVGNPFVEPASIDHEFYVMNGEGSEIAAAEVNTVAPMEGIFVVAEGENESVTFTPTPQNANANNASLVVSLSQGAATNRSGVSTPSTGSGTAAVIDRVIVRFDSNRRLPKFQLYPNSTKVYIPQSGKDYAVVNIGRDAAHHLSTMPLNFKAAKDGTYTLTFDMENVEFDYLHLIDNLTGADVDLSVVESVVEPVETPTQGNGPSMLRLRSATAGSGTVASYTFTARTTDYESRFKLVFACGDGPSTGSGTFAYISNGNIIINGEGTLQVIDVMGRVIRTVELSQSGSHTTTTGMPAGVYVLRLLDGDSVKTQKTVIE